MLLTVGTVRLVRSRRSATADDDPLPQGKDFLATEDAALARAADEALVELRIEGDARRAIIGCYAQMERSLARAGRARRPSEAPLEYLATVLASVAPVDGRALTDLYERAMFSTERMSDRDKVRAISALTRLRHAAGT